MSLSLLELGYQLLEKLNIRRLYVFPEHLELHFTNDNSKIIAFGNTEEEVIENFYQLYQEMYNPA